ncbi:MAG: translation initiation factor IF-2 [Chloroflexi bacterium]|nr:translation initiation factor IF-2 [Chloroflexota bacterium]
MIQRQHQGTASREAGDAGVRPGPSSRLVPLPEAITVGHLAELVHASPIDLMKQLMRAGVMAAINQSIDFKTAAAIIPAFGYRAVEATSPSKATKEKDTEEEDLSQLQVRPPVVTILGHVDHGKTTLLDAIRKTKVAERETGGITQHIGAYQTEYKGHKITFLDTPGHEAFTAMRARGANATDIAVLVVAADDGIMPQTVEAINHARAAKVPIVVAVNKIDKPEADPDRVKRQLAGQGLLIEEWGGDVIAVPVSAKAQTGIDDLLENLLVVAEVADLKANPNRPARGVVVEAKLDKSRGPVASALVKTGTLNVGDYLVVGNVSGRVKALVSDAGRRMRSAPPSTPVEILGLNGLPLAGDVLQAVSSEREAKAIAEERLRKQEGTRRSVSLEEVVGRIRTGESKELSVVIKADVQGSLEAIRDTLVRLGTEKAQVRIVHAASGAITETDIFLAVASQAVILGFNTSMEPGARRLAESEGVEIRFYNIIYTMVEEIQGMLEGLVKPVARDVVEGHAAVRAVITRGRQSKVAGCMVSDGRILRNASVRVLRSGRVLYDGPVQSLRRFQEDVREVAAGMECGIVLAKFDEFQEGDILEVHRQEQPSGR